MSSPTSSASYGCLSCGACCATFRVSFYWAEARACGLPPELLEQISPYHGCLKGTDGVTPRCVALHGTIGEQAFCSIYSQRPAPCHIVQPGDSQCLKARIRHGLPISPPNDADRPDA